MNENLARLRRDFIDKYPELKDMDNDLLSLSMIRISKFANRRLKKIGKEKYGSADYERLEFLGDSVLGLITAEFVFNKYELYNSHLLTENKSKMVRNTSLYCLAKSKNMCSLILPNFHLQKECADFLEALVGAIYFHLKQKGTPNPTEIIEVWLNNEFQYELHLDNIIKNPNLMNVCESQKSL